MNSETLLPASSPEHSAQRDLTGVLSDSRRRQLDIFRQRESESEVEWAPGGPLEPTSGS
ncbi:hypothetical protein [Cryobacterium roopkundense]|uniref:Uncharacterized protein n=1 Tax=Cryobacterium roopkundense TaxID=1001240 RepID=A0A7W8ZUX2_9MICO|nr:hypothetical protein [Cryobacterium roopkundense]MBB5640649.1 hypothetical protein [Cryobacterium roopkundense]